MQLDPNTLLVIGAPCGASDRDSAKWGSGKGSPVYMEALRAAIERESAITVAKAKAIVAQICAENTGFIAWATNNRGWLKVAPPGTKPRSVPDENLSRETLVDDIQRPQSLSAETADDIELAAEYVPDGIDRRPVVERQIRERRGQQQFRDDLRERYGDQCLVTGCEILAIVEAAHINPYRGENDHHPENGLLLRSDIHTLFDLDLLGIEPDSMRVQLHPGISTEYAAISGVVLKSSPDVRPSARELQKRYNDFIARSKRPL